MLILDVLRERRSIRNFRPDPVPEGLLAVLFEAVRWAPSGGNIQPWEIVVIRDENRKKALRETLGENNPASRAIQEALLLLVLCGRVGVPAEYQGKVHTKFGDSWLLFHLGTAAQNLCLAAHAVGLGTLMTGFFDHDRARDVLEVPPGYEVVLLVPVGFPARVPRPPARRAVEDFVHFERFGSRTEGSGSRD